MYNLVNRPKTNSKYNFKILKTAVMFVGSGGDMTGLRSRADPHMQAYNLCIDLRRSVFPTGW